MTRKKTERFVNWKFIFLLVLGAIFALVGSLLAGNVEIGLGVSSTTFTFILIISFLLFLMAGLSWLGVALAIKEIEEK